MVLVQKGPFFQLFFLGNIGQENVFDDILERKSTFVGHKNNKFKRPQNWHFSKGVNRWFWVKKWPFFQLVFFRQFRPRKCLLRYSRMKNGFLRYKNKKFKDWHFCKGFNPWFCPKMAIFPTFFFSQFRPRKYLLRYSRTKKRLSSL